MKTTLCSGGKYLKSMKLSTQVIENNYVLSLIKSEKMKFQCYFLNFKKL